MRAGHEAGENEKEGKLRIREASGNSSMEEMRGNKVRGRTRGRRAGEKGRTSIKRGKNEK